MLLDAGGGKYALRRPATLEKGGEKNKMKVKIFRNFGVGKVVAAGRIIAFLVRPKVTQNRISPSPG